MAIENNSRSVATVFTRHGIRMTWRHAFEFLNYELKESAREKSHVFSYLTRKNIFADRICAT